MLEVREVTMRFGGIVALDRLSFHLEEGQTMGLIGPNGSGKTVLFNIITALLRPEAGEVRFRGERLTSLPAHQIIRRGIARTFQSTEVFPGLTVLENLLMAAQPKALGRNLASALENLARTEAETARRALELLEFFGLAPLRDERAGNLSYGQQKLLAFATALMADPEPSLILLDELMAGVNPTIGRRLMDRIREFHRAGKTFLLIEHDMKVIMNLCETVVALDQGRLIAWGTPAEVQAEPRVLEAYFGR